MLSQLLLRFVNSATHSTSLPETAAGSVFSKRLLPLAIYSLGAFALLAFPNQAYALCANLAGAEGEIVYNDTYNVVQFCDGTSWISMTGAIASSMDSRIGSIVNDKWCGADSSGIINCTLTPPASTSSGSVGYIQFSNAGGAFADSGTTPGQQLFWDNSNKRLGIGTATPDTAIEAVGTIKASSGLLWSANGSAATLRNLLLENFDTSSSANGVDVGVKLGGTEFQGLSWVKETAWDAAAAAGSKDAMLQLGVLNDNVAANRVYVRADGKVGIGVASPVAALDVNGGVRIGDQTTCTDGTHNGTLRYNAGALEICGTTGWVAVGTGGGGGAGGDIASIEYATAYTTASTSWVDVPGFSITITPSSASAKVLVIANVNAGMASAAAGNYRIVRDGTPIAVPTTVSGYTSVSSSSFYTGGGGSFDANSNTEVTAVYLDTPNTASAVIYKIQAISSQGGVMRFNALGSDVSGNNWSQRARSSLTAFEVGGSGSGGGGSTTLAALTDVSTTGIANGKALVYNSTSSKWEPQTISSGSGTVSGTLNKIAKFTGATTVGDSVITDSGGNVGIGTTSPASLLQVAGGVQLGDDTATCPGASNVKIGTLRFNGGALQLCGTGGWSVVGSGVPTGTIAAFASASCPTGWTEYVAARGRFLRGIDNGAGVDPSGTRAPGASQPDAFQGHWHDFKRNSGSAHGAGSPYESWHGTTSSSPSYAAGVVNAPIGDGLNGTPRTSSETRPQNVAVTFCQYSGGAPLVATPSGAAGEIQYADGSGGLTSDANILVSGGKVGIGTASPSERLDLGGGNIKMGYTQVSVVGANSTQTTATCPSGMRATGGGVWPVTNWTAPIGSEPSGNNAWNGYQSSGAVRVTVICANIR